VVDRGPLLQVLSTRTTTPVIRSAPTSLSLDARAHVTTPGVSAGTYLRASVDRGWLFQGLSARATTAVIRSAATGLSLNASAYVTTSIVTVPRETRPGSRYSRVTVPGGSGGRVWHTTRFVLDRLSRVGVGMTVDMSHTCFDLHATTVRHGSVMGSVPGLCHVVDGCKRSTANILADTVSGLEDASIQID